MTVPTIEMLAARRWPASAYRHEVVAVARALIGSVLVHRRRAGMIVEVEAYGGPDDLASHTRFGVTARNAVMFGPGGVAYVYLCYGIHEMFNIVTGPDGVGQAVLVRAIAPLVGFGDAPDPAVGRGPGKVTRAMLLDRRQDGRDLTRGALFIASGEAPPEIASGPRIGVDFAGPWAAEPLRFWWRDHPAVSGSRGRGGAIGALGRTTATRRKRSR